jgi:NAD+-dependent secondary alcohol dehydrogenase Adh1
VIVKVAAAGVCATDLHAQDGDMVDAGVTLPRVLGHENAGYVEAVGDLVETVSVGDPVLVFPPHSCGLCVPCRRGIDMHCERHGFTGLTMDGGFAEYVRVGERSLVPLGPGIDPVAVAPHSDAGITAYHAVKRMAPRLAPGSTAVIIGCGGVGHIAVQLVRELGSSKVVVVDTDERRRKLAGELGADEVLEGGDQVVDQVREATDGRGAEVVLDFVGSDATHAAGIEMLVFRGGTYAIVGFGGVVTAPSGMLVGQEKAVVANLVGTWTDLWELMQLHAAGGIELRTETHSLDDVNDVMAKLREGEVTGRAVLTP